MTTLPSLCRTKALVLELLAAVCLVRGGHDIILAAFDNFKEVLELSPLNQPISQQTCSCFLVFLGAVLLAAVASAGDVGWAFGEHRVGTMWDGETLKVRRKATQQHCLG